jgi:hypothetical protein
MSKLTITPPGFLTEGNTSEDALILEARWLLAHRYRADMRCIEANSTINKKGRFSIPELLEIWDLSNSDAEKRSRRDYWVMKQLQLDVWGDEPTTEPK